MTGDALLSTLPDHLSERVWRPHPRALGAGDVIYWVRTAVRAHENPALDVALHVARQLDRPFWIYHALSERYPFASDRHHRFILEGARDLEAECRRLGFRYAFHLERPGHRGPHLQTLASSAALIVTEDVPVSPLREWTERLASSSGAPVWAVDAACTFPMRRAPAGAVDRAYRFRSATAPGRAARLEAGWPAVDALPRASTTALPFEPVELATADLDALVASCAIDHSIAPVPHTPGGSTAGYARWQTFLERGMASYNKRRNDPLQDGVSRMSAYLHYGQVSPFRLARETLDRIDTHGGAQKYLDELCVWRELAWAFCAARPHHDQLEVLPDWARTTLRAHESDARPALPTWETLSRGTTGDPLWDAAQASLRIHGELHNNVRMTWGKRLLSWTSDAQTALDLLIDLNHRFALDGRDPASYGGLLWCLGVFDRPFPPERPILGTVRERSSIAHARRIDLTTWARRTSRPAIAKPPRVAIVGGGIAGLACARTLRDHGLSARVFDKGRRPGGRCATREDRADPDVQFDHGAQYFTARSPWFRRLVDSWQRDGVVARWTIDPSKDTWVGAPSMAALPQHLATGLTIESGVRIQRILPGRGTLELRDDVGDDRGTFDVVVVTTPAAQARPLVEASIALSTAADRAVLTPCWAALLTFDHPLDLPDHLRPDGRVIAWAARDSSKPGRPPGERWVVHATTEWSQIHRDADPDDVASHLTLAFGLHAPGRVPCRRPIAHHWRFARAVDGAGTSGASFADPATGLVLAGDWVAGASRIEAAWLSGVSAAARVLSMGRQGPTERGGPPSAGADAADLQGNLFDL